MEILMPDSMFPVPKDAHSHGATDVKWFAGMAMQAIIGKQGVPRNDAEREEVALWAFRMAQAMVATDKRLHASEES
jgi:hypothetical protein